MERKKKNSVKPITNNRRYYYQLIQQIFSNTPFLLKSLFFVTFSFLLFDEIYLKQRILTDKNVINGLNEIALNLSFNCLAGCIFYFVTIQVPKEVKKTKMHIYLHNRTSFLLLEIDDIYKTLIEYTDYNTTIETITEEDLQKLLIQKSPHDMLNSTVERCSFNCWVDYWLWKREKIKIYLTDILPYNELLSTEFIKYLIWTENLFLLMDNNIKYMKEQRNMHMFQIALLQLLGYKNQLSELSQKEFRATLQIHGYEFRAERKSGYSKKTLSKK